MRRIGLFAVSVSLWAASSLSPAYGLTPQEALGKSLFFDKNLSINANQSCATCHGPAVGWTGPDEEINAHGAVYEGSISGAFGDRKPPSAAYGGDSPILYYDGSAWVGGMFWDGRATGWRLGDPLAEQAQGPFLNPKEQALPSPGAVIGIVQASTYAAIFANQCPGTDTTELYNCIGRAIAAYERSSEVSAFTSKYDYWLKGKGKLSSLEHLGRALFQGKAKCAGCHPIKGKAPLFTDFTYDNLGIPKNPENPVYDDSPSFIDQGLGGFLATVSDYQDYAEENRGKHKVPTLRNVAKGACEEAEVSGCITKAYGHNGYFKSLAGIVNFYNTRDVKPVCDGSYTEAQALAANCWPVPELAANLNTAELGALGLSAAEETAIVAFMKTLSDGYTP